MKHVGIQPGALGRSNLPVAIGAVSRAGARSYRAVSQDASETGGGLSRSNPPAVGNQNGSVLVVALLILVFLTLIGISASTITQIEIQIAGNERAYNIAFNTADSGVYLSPKVIRRTIEDGAQLTTLTHVNCTPASPGFFRRVMGYELAPNDTGTVQFNLTQNNYPVNVGVKRVKQISLGGGGVEFGSGAEGVGVGSAGGVAVIYDLDSQGSGPSNAQSNIIAEYRLVPGVAGGL